jgi:hypothetical protein
MANGIDGGELKTELNRNEKLRLFEDFWNDNIKRNFHGYWEAY